MKITKHINEGFIRFVYWNECKAKTESKNLYKKNPTRFHLDGSFQGVKSLFVLLFHNTNNHAKKVERDSHKQSFLPRVNMTNYNVLIGQPIKNQIKKYDEIRKFATGQRDD